MSAKANLMEVNYLRIRDVHFLFTNTLSPVLDTTCLLSVIAKTTDIDVYTHVSLQLTPSVITSLYMYLQSSSTSEVP